LVQTNVEENVLANENGGVLIKLTTTQKRSLYVRKKLWMQQTYGLLAEAILNTP